MSAPVPPLLKKIPSISHHSVTEENTNYTHSHSSPNAPAVDTVIVDQWHSLNSIIETANEKFDSILEIHENDFLKAFKHQMFRL